MVIIYLYTVGPQKQGPHYHSLTCQYIYKKNNQCNHLNGSLCSVIILFILDETAIFNLSCFVSIWYCKSSAWSSKSNNEKFNDEENYVQMYLYNRIFFEW